MSGVLEGHVRHDARSHVPPRNCKGGSGEAGEEVTSHGVREKSECSLEQQKLEKAASAMIIQLFRRCHDTHSCKSTYMLQPKALTCLKCLVSVRKHEQGCKLCLLASP